jgi:hypothetical protein
MAFLGCERGDTEPISIDRWFFRVIAVLVIASAALPFVASPAQAATQGLTATPQGVTAGPPGFWVYYQLSPCPTAPNSFPIVVTFRLDGVPAGATYVDGAGYFVPARTQTYTAPGPHSAQFGCATFDQSTGTQYPDYATYPASTITVSGSSPAPSVSLMIAQPGQGLTIGPGQTCGTSAQYTSAQVIAIAHWIGGGGATVDTRSVSVAGDGRWAPFAVTIPTSIPSQYAEVDVTVDCYASGNLLVSRNTTVLMAPPGTAGTGTVADGPRAASSSPGQEDVFARGYDDAVWTRHFTNGAWAGWNSLGGIVTGAAAVASRQSGQLDMFSRGSDGALWSRRFANGAWGAWYSLGGILSTAPSVVSAQSGQLDVFVGGQDKALWVRHFDGSAWGAWSTLGGIVTAEAGPVSSSPGTLDVFVRGQDAALWTRRFNGAGWTPWTPLGGILVQGPSAASTGPGVIDVFVRGNDNGVWTRHSASSWSGWSTLGGLITAPPAAISNGGTLEVFVRGYGGDLWSRGIQGGTWGLWNNLGGLLK